MAALVVAAPAAVAEVNSYMSLVLVGMEGVTETHVAVRRAVAGAAAVTQLAADAWAREADETAAVEEIGAGAEAAAGARQAAMAAAAEEARMALEWWRDSGWETWSRR